MNQRGTDPQLTKFVQLVEAQSVLASGVVAHSRVVRRASEMAFNKEEQQTIKERIGQLASASQQMAMGSHIADDLADHGGRCNAPRLAVLVLGDGSGCGRTRNGYFSES